MFGPTAFYETSIFGSIRSLIARCIVRAFSRLCVAAALCCSVLSLFSFAQQVALPSQPALSGKAEAAPATVAGHTISLDVVVTDKAGNPIPGLQQQDFTLLDDKQPKKITSFRARAESDQASDPIQAILLVDAVNSSDRGVAYQQEQLQRFFRRDGGHLPIPTSLLIFTDTSTQVQPQPTQDGNILAAALNANQPGLRAIGRSAGFYGAADRLQLSLQALQGIIQYEANQPGRKLLIWISPGWPLLSGPDVELTSKEREAIFREIVALCQQMREARITLYAVDPLGTADAGSFRTFYYETFLKGVTSSNKVDNGNLALQVLAVQSGGRVLNSSNDVPGLIATCLADSKAYYSISFESPPADHPDEYHALAIKVDKPGLTPRTRTGYYAQPYTGRPVSEP
jgi:VWFA-related protein